MSCNKGVALKREKSILLEQPFLGKRPSKQTGELVVNEPGKQDKAGFGRANESTGNIIWLK